MVNKTGSIIIQSMDGKKWRQDNIVKQTNDNTLPINNNTCLYLILIFFLFVAEQT